MLYDTLQYTEFDDAADLRKEKAHLSIRYGYCLENLPQKFIHLEGHLQPLK